VATCRLVLTDRTNWLSRCNVAQADNVEILKPVITDDIVPEFSQQKGYRKGTHPIMPSMLWRTKGSRYLTLEEAVIVSGISKYMMSMLLRTHMIPYVKKPKSIKSSQAYGITVETALYLRGQGQSKEDVRRLLRLTQWVNKNRHYAGMVHQPDKGKLTGPPKSAILRMERNRQETRKRREGLLDL